MKSKKLKTGSRYYFRGWSVLGMFNTLTSCLFNRVLVIARNTESNKIVSWWFDTATNWPPAEN